MALLSHSSFGSSDAPSARKMREALDLILAARAGPGGRRRDARATRRCPRRSATANSPSRASTTDANLLIMPNVDAANITYNALRVAAGKGITVGGILLGAAKPVHILTPSATVRRIVNMTAFAVAEAAQRRKVATGV